MEIATILHKGTTLGSKKAHSPLSIPNFHQECKGVYKTTLLSYGAAMIMLR